MIHLKNHNRSMVEFLKYVETASATTFNFLDSKGRIAQKFGSRCTHVEIHFHDDTKFLITFQQFNDLGDDIKFRIGMNSKEELN